MEFLSTSGRIQLGIGSVGMVLFAGIFLVINLFSSILQVNLSGFHTLNITLTANTLGPSWWFLSGIITGISGLIGIKGYFDLAIYREKKDVLFTWGVFGIVLGLVGGTIGGFIVIIGGSMLLISYFQ